MGKILQQERLPFSSFEIDFPSSSKSQSSSSQQQSQTFSSLFQGLLATILYPFSSSRNNVPVWKIVIVVGTISAISLLSLNTLPVTRFSDTNKKNFNNNNGGRKGNHNHNNNNMPSTEEKTALVNIDIPNDDDDDGKKQSASISTSRRNIYHPRGRTMSETEREVLTSKWGSWMLDGNDDDTITKGRHSPHDFYSEFLNRDVPNDKFPTNSWQHDIEYVEQFVNESTDLVGRAMEAILSEYGHGKVHYPNNTFEERSTMFHVQIYDDTNNSDGEIPYNDIDDDDITTSNNDKGGWTTQTSWDGLKRRLLHAIMTEDTFVFAMGGHGAAQGLGNHFQQSYTLQVQWIMEPIFARLGVQHESRNFGNDGLGTMHNAIGAGSIYGPDVDILMYDSLYTEDGDDRAVDLFARQAILGGEKVPILWNLSPNVARALHKFADVDIGHFGTSMAGIPVTTDTVDAEEIVWAAQYVNCINETRHEVCDPHLFNGMCWIHRYDYTPMKKQLSSLPHSKHPSSSAQWDDDGEDYPGNRQHQLKGRTIAFTLLLALHEVLKDWGNWIGTEGRILPDNMWHVSAHYESIRAKISDLDPKISGCGLLEHHGLEFLCKYPFKARTEFTPRSYPQQSSIRSIVAPAMVSKIPLPHPNAYDAPDVFNPALYPPFGEVDVLSIVENGVNFTSFDFAPSYADFYNESASSVGVCQGAKGSSSCQAPGDGVTLLTYPGDHMCDGTLNSFCNRGDDNDCLLDGHNFGRGGLRFDSESGWIVMNVPDIRYGYIVLMIESWHRHGDAVPGRTPTKWHPNNPLCSEFQFEYSIDGKITSLNRHEYEEKKQGIQHLVEVLTVMENPNFTDGGVNVKNVEVAIRITGCKKDNVFMLTHVYWA